LHIGRGKVVAWEALPVAEVYAGRLSDKVPATKHRQGVRFAATEDVLVGFGVDVPLVEYDSIADLNGYWHPSVSSPVGTRFIRLTY
jgi:hypothetical protein